MLTEVSTAVACAGFFAIATLAVTRGRREPLAARLAVLCLVLFAYTALDLPKQRVWVALAAATGTMAAPVFFHFVVTFLGQRRERAKWVVAAYVYFAALATACVASLLVANMEDFPNGPIWSALALFGIVPMAVAGAVLLVRHARSSHAEERARTALVLACVIVAGSGVVGDLTAIGLGRPHGASALALVASAALLAVAALRSKLLERVSVLVALSTVGVSVAVVLLELALFQGAGSKTALAAVGSVVVALLSLFAGRLLFAATTESREQARADAVLGRLTRQMAHDLRNPIAGVRGAAEFLRVERERGHSLAAQGEYLDMLVELADRMTRVLEQYQRLGRVEPKPVRVDLAPLLSRAARTLTRQVTVDVGEGIPTLFADGDLLAIAIENVLRNADEAMGSGDGHVRIEARARGGEVTIAIADSGPGMDARTRERAFDEFFTTKATGSGLGLAFVRRVAEAHGGRASLESVEGEGTRVTLTLPLREIEADA